MKTIDEIVNGSYKVTEKQDMLHQLKKEFNDEINEAIEQVKIGYKYCPECKEYYKNKAWDTKHRTEKRNVCTYTDPVQWTDNKYEDKVCSVTYDICPMGHVIDRDITW